MPSHARAPRGNVLRPEPIPCSQCGMMNYGRDLCVHHHQVLGDDWAKSNKIMCDFFHRGVLLARVAEDPSDWDPYWEGTVAGL
jgi:hypothetical protein